MSQAVQALSEQNDLLRQQVTRYAVSTDTIAARLADALQRLRPHDPEYVANALGEAVSEPSMTPTTAETFPVETPKPEEIKHD